MRVEGQQKGMVLVSAARKDAVCQPKTLNTQRNHTFNGNSGALKMTFAMLIPKGIISLFDG
jgi:hypothetical protein